MVLLVVSESNTYTRTGMSRWQQLRGGVNTSEDRDPLRELVLVHSEYSIDTGLELWQMESLGLNLELWQMESLGEDVSQL
jgi:hypothetical protein